MSALGVVAIAGSGLVAMEQSSVSSLGNSLTAGVIEAGGGLAIARVDDPAACPEANWGTAPIPALVLDRVDTADPAWRLDGPVVCLRNEGADRVELHVTATNVGDIELGPCEAGEQAAGDTSCSDGEAGELGHAVVLGWDHGGGDAACTGTARSFGDHVTDQVALGGLSPGAWCGLKLSVGIDSDEAVRARAQSDRLQWDLVLTGTPEGHE